MDGVRAGESRLDPKIVELAAIALYTSFISRQGAMYPPWKDYDPVKKAAFREDARAVLQTLEEHHGL